jgi:hypothetical protein
MKYPEGMSVIITDNAVTIDYDGELWTTKRGMRSYGTVMEVLRDFSGTKHLVELLQDAFDLDAPDVESYVAEHGQGLITFDGIALRYGNDPIKGPITRRIRALAANNLPFDNLLKFLENLYQNPSYSSIKQLYGFLEAHDMPIAEDGTFVAYKVINSNFTDCHTGKISNAVGSRVSMPRHTVEDNPERTCSSGLHVCANEYARGFFWGSNRILVAVRVNPRDVVSVPTDYNNAKMRVCEYVVDRVLEEGPEKDELTGRIYYGFDARINYEDDPLDDDYDSSWIASEDADGYPEMYDDLDYEDYTNEDRNYW